MTVTLPASDRSALLAAEHAEQTTRVQLEIAVTRAKLAALESRAAALDAQAAKNAVIGRLAAAHGFDADRPFTYDAATGVLTQPDAGSADGHV